MSGLMNFWYDMVNAVQSATPVLVTFGGIVGIFVIVFFSIYKIRGKNDILAIMASTILSCLLMVPTISAFNHLVDIKIEGTIIDEAKVEIKKQRAEAAKLLAENKIKILEKEKLNNQITVAKQTIEIAALNDNIALLSNAQLSVQSFQKILELALLQTNLKQTQVYKNQITTTKKGMGITADYYNDEVLVVTTHDINAKFGVDLNEVKIVKLDGNAVVVSGIRPVFIGADKNITTTPIKEIRRNSFKKDVISSIDIQNDTTSVNLADKYAETYKTEFQTKLSSELSFMDDAVVQLAQNFIKVMLAPLYKNINFDNVERPDALSIIDYLQKELQVNNERKNKLLDINGNLFLGIEKLETETAKVELEVGSIEIEE